jgi:hypothetical protein
MDILHLRLINNDQIAARLLDNNEDSITVEFPLLIETLAVDGITGINMSRYMPFDYQQILMLKKDHIVAMTETSEEFAKYYYNTIHYQSLYIQPQTDKSLKKINEKLEQVLSDDNQEFLESVKRLRDRIPEIPTTMQ